MKLTNVFNRRLSLSVQLAAFLLFCNVAASAQHQDAQPANPVAAATASTTPNPAAPDAVPATSLGAATPAPIRFLVTFDDGPSGSDGSNPTALVLDTLAHNAVQSGVKVVFFTQTRASNGGGSEIGRALMRREFAEGHLLGLHSATPHHTNHRHLSPEELDASLSNGAADLRSITGVAPTLVRPPFWNYDAATLSAYHRHGMQMLLTDLSANDGKTIGVNFSWHKHSNLLDNLRKTRLSWAAGKMPVVDGYTPVVVTFHDVNSYTARHVEEYLAILVQVAAELDMPTAPLPFYTDKDALERAALASAIPDGDIHHPLPGLWNWIWQ